MKTIVLVSDVLVSEQVNGVATWLVNSKRELEKQGFRVVIFDASFFRHTVSLPGYPEIRLVISSKKRVEDLLKKIQPDYIHIATEATLGYITRAVCVKNKWAFTSSYHTRFPEYVFVRTGINFFQTLVYSYLRWFHGVGARTIVTTEKLKKELEEKKFTHLEVVPLGVDVNLFKRNPHAVGPLGMQKPVFVYLGRVSIEKNVEDFLQCKLPGSKLVIGDGPARKELEQKYSQSAYFVGCKKGQELVDLLSISAVCVFPSKTDTFGLTIIEALACGLPVAAYDVQGPNTIIVNGSSGYLGDNLEESAVKCLSLDGEICRNTAKNYSWEYAVKKFATMLVSR